MPLVNAYDKNLNGYVGFFGTPLTTINLRVICPSTTVPGATIVSTNPNTFGSTFPTWNVNTGGWCNWNPDPSIIPTNSIVDYAILVWSTAYYPPLSPTQEVTANTAPVTLKKPDGSTHQVTPNPAYNLSFNAGWYQFTHAAEITSIMQDNQYGNYFLTNVITGATQGSNGLGGWGLYIVYKNPLFPYRNVNLNVAATGFNQTLTISNLILPVTGPVNARVFVSSVQGDRGYGDSLLLNSTVLSGPYNPATDFMNDRYVDYTGLALQSVGSLLVQSGSDYGYYADQTVINNSTALTNTDTQAVLTQQNTTDWAGVSLLGLMVDLNAANLSPVTKAVDKTVDIAGGTLTYTVTFTNTGTTTAINVVFIDTLPAGVTFVPNSLTINSVPDIRSVTSPITLPNVAPGATTTLTFKVTTQSFAPPGTTYSNYSTVNYDFKPDSTTTVSNSVPSNTVTTSIIDHPLSITKSEDKSIALCGDTVTYTNVITNSGTSNVQNILFKDPIPDGTTFVTNSVYINGSQQIGANPETGFTIPLITPGSSVTITFSVTVSCS